MVKQSFQFLIEHLGCYSTFKLCQTCIALNYIIPKFNRFRDIDLKLFCNAFHEALQRGFLFIEVMKMK